MIHATDWIIMSVAIAGSSLKCWIIVSQLVHLLVCMEAGPPGSGKSHKQVPSSSHRNGSDMHQEEQTSHLCKLSRKDLQAPLNVHKACLYTALSNSTSQVIGAKERISRQERRRMERQQKKKSKLGSNPASNYC